MFDYRRTHDCGQLNKSHLGMHVTLSGWVHRRRDHGGLIFIDLRDRHGLTQLLFDPERNPQAHAFSEQLRSEWVISIRGIVIPRAQGMTNEKLSTGEIEIQVEEFSLLSKAETPPFSICDEITETHEETRLKHRYLDLRRGEVSNNLVLRHKITHAVRAYLHDHKFIEISTPILARSTPEGARDFLVPSRIYPGNFYALPQSPQLFKQLLMIGGMDRYYQIATCFRDEDLRSDRQLEFTQIDIEMSFLKPSDLILMMEGMMAEIFKTCLGLEIHTPFPQLTYHECMEKYGSDRPDLRYDMTFTRLDDIAKESEFGVFRDVVSSGGVIKAICVKEGAELSRKEIENYTNFVRQFGLGGLAWMKCGKEGLTSSITKFFTKEQLDEIAKRTNAKEGDLLFFAAASEGEVNQSLDHLRRLLAKERGLIDDNVFNFLWVYDFPLVEWDPKEERMKSLHHPFTSPHESDIDLIDSQPLKVRSLAYDLVINGVELGGGSQRIHDASTQQKVFQLLKLSEEEIKSKFGFFLEALSYGTPPHLGIAFGLDRFVMLLAKTDNIRDVIAFPKTQKGSDLMMQAPAHVATEQLDDLKIKIDQAEISWK